MKHLKVENINKRFGNKVVLSNIEFGLNQGEIVALMGESGCGKSTLLRIIAGFENADNGKILLNDKGIQDVVAHKRKVGMFFQDYALFPHMTVFDNIAYGITGQENYSEKVKELIDVCELGGLEKVYPHEISGGQKQRVALARALAPDPDILLLDEPFSNIDTLLRENLRLELRRMLKGRNLSVIIVSHDIEDALVLADKAVILHEGIIVQEGSIRALYNQPKNEFVAQFVGEVNIINGSTTDFGLQTGDTIIFGDFTNCKSKEMKIAVRPEDISLENRNEPGNKYKVKQVIFKRSFYIVELEGEKGRIIAHLSNDQEWSEGDTCQLKITRYHAI